MNKPYKTIPLLLVAFSLVTVCYAQTQRFGISDYEAHPQVRIGEDAEPFKIARISNEGHLSEGDFNFTVTPIFTPYYNKTAAELQLVFTPNSAFLQPQDSVLFYGKVVSATKKGTFQGMVDFNCSVDLPLNYTGNPSTGGGSAKITVTILEPSPPALFVLPPLTLLLPLILVPSLGIPISVFAYRRHKHHVKLPPSIKTKEETKPSPKPKRTPKPKKHEDEDPMELFANLGTKKEKDS